VSFDGGWFFFVLVFFFVFCFFFVVVVFFTKCLTQPPPPPSYVTECVPQSSCVGTRDSLCADGYEGFQCGKCSKDFYRANGQCNPCPVASSATMFVIGDVAVWLLFALSAVAIRERMTLSYIVMIIRALSLLSAIGKMTEGEDVPRWVLTVYEVLYIFSGDYSFVKPDCVTPAPWAQLFGISLAYNVAVFIPVFLALAVVRLIAKDDGEIDHDTWTATEEQPVRPRTKSFWTDRMVRMCVIWGTVMYLSITSLALETLSCTPVGITGEYRMITRPHEMCYAGDHIVLSAVSTILLLGFTCGYPLAMLKWVRNPEHKTLIHGSERFMERWNYLYEFYNVKNPTFWLIEFPITCIVAAGHSLLRPHVNSQLGISVALFAYKLIYICFRRPFIDWMTDVIQGVLGECVGVVFLKKKKKIEIRRCVVEFAAISWPHSSPIPLPFTHSPRVDGGDQHELFRAARAL
jgi:hypothetical protein